MPSILPGYEYDIFISYRQNDNKRDGWVTNFVDALKDELEATLKNPVSIYFDENPHDGLLESHQVGASLEKKLKCLVFIPVVSQTYCDTTSFAWQHEFLPFIEMANSDALGMNVTVEKGNVASRVLPIKIHDLDPHDQGLMEQALQGPMRSIDFIYKEAGVNRPLKPTDERKLNLEKTDYHNQINKVANALKSIGSSIIDQNTSDQSSVKESPGEVNRPVLPKKKKKPNFLIYVVLALAALLIASYYLLPGFSEEISLEDKQKSIAVLPFRNDSDDPDNEYFCNGLMEDIINQLSKIPDLRVPSATSMLYYRDHPKPIEEIVEELNVSYLLEASIRKMEGKALMNITLIDAEQNEQIWTERMEMDLSVKDLFDIQFEVARNVANKMRIALVTNKSDIPTNNYQAYDNCIKARDLMHVWDMETNRKAIALLQEAARLDENYIDAYSLLGQAYGQRAELGQDWADSARYYASIAYAMDNKYPSALNALGYAYALEGNPREALRLYLESFEISPNAQYNYAGWCYQSLGKFDKAVEWASRNISNDPKNSIYYVDMVNATSALQLWDYATYYTELNLSINPVQVFVNDNLYLMENIKGNYKKAIGYLKENYAIDGAPNWKIHIGILHYKMGNLDSAALTLNDVKLYKENNEMDNNSRQEIFRGLSYKALVEFEQGQEEKARKDLEALVVQAEKGLSDSRHEKFQILAGCYALLGDNASSLSQLRRAEEVAPNDYNFYLNYDLLKPLYDDPAFISLRDLVKENNDKMREKVLNSGYLEK